MVPILARRHTYLARQPDSHPPISSLTRRQLAGIYNLIGFLEERLLGRSAERRSGQGHETGTGGLEDTKRRNELEEGVDSRGLGGTVIVS